VILSERLCGLTDIFDPENESPADKEWRLELCTIARLLCTRPNSRRATKIENPFPLYRIDDRKTDKALALVSFQNISREYLPGKPAPAFRDRIAETVKLAELSGLAAFVLFHWRNTHWGFAKLPAFFELNETLPKAPGNDSILLISPERFVGIYEYSRDKSSKING
jgi:hypothetical protein